MILSKSRKDEVDPIEFTLVRDLSHIATVWVEIERRLPQYWQAFVKREAEKNPAGKLASHFGAKVTGTKDVSVASQSFSKAVQQYEKVAAKYRDFFDPEAMEEFADDPNSFKSHLAKEVPVIAGTLNQRRPELQEWQSDFRASKGRDLLEVFSNVLDFRSTWAKAQSEKTYVNCDEPAAFALDPLDSDESMSLTSVIGMGIKSIVLYHLDARILPQRTRLDLYGLYFLSGMSDFKLPSKSSEFLMINDLEPVSGSFIMEHNFWYPYGVYSVYVSRIFRWLDQKAREAGGALDTHVRYVYVSHFLQAVCSEHAEDMKIMRVHDRFGVPA